MCSDGFTNSNNIMGVIDYIYNMVSNTFKEMGKVKTYAINILRNGGGVYTQVK